MDADKAREIIEESLADSYEPYTFEDVFRSLADGSAKLILGKESLAILTLQDEKYRSVHTWVGGGNLKELQGPVLTRGEAWARAQGAEYATIESSRAGWPAALPGYEEVARIYRKKL